MTSKEQLRLWVAGYSQHNTEQDECCPDFSCCNGGKKVDLQTRERFSKAYLENDEETVHCMLMGFLSNSFPKAHVAGYETKGNA